MPVRYPAAGTIRVGVTPEVAPPPPRRDLTSGREFEAGPNRFDDPYAEFVMRYSATTLRCCMVELLGRFRPHPLTDAILADVAGIDDGDGQFVADRDSDDPEAPLMNRTATTGEGVAEWLSRQELVALRLADSTGLVDATDGDLLRELDKHPLVINQLAKSPLSPGSYRQRLEPGVMGLGGPIGRAITSAASRALYEVAPGATGWRYPSRLDASEECWALYADRVRVSYDPPQPLNRADPLHRAAVRAAAAYLEVPLPDSWS